MDSLCDGPEYYAYPTTIWAFDYAGILRTAFIGLGLKVLWALFIKKIKKRNSIKLSTHIFSVIKARRVRLHTLFFILANFKRQSRAGLRHIADNISN